MVDEFGTKPLLKLYDDRLIAMLLLNKLLKLLTEVLLETLLVFKLIGQHMVDRVLELGVAWYEVIDIVR